MTDASVVYKTTANAARFAPKPADAKASAAPRTFGRLGLRVVGDDGDDDTAGTRRKPPSTPEPAYATVYPSVLDGVSEAARAAPATAGMVLETLDAAIAVSLDGDGVLKAQVARLEMENARLTSSLSEVRAKLAELDFVTERLKVENKGPPGAKGERGRDGRDGPQGLRGDKGERGVEGLAAPVIVSWRIDTSAFTATPLMSNGKDAPTLHARSWFEAFNEAILAGDEAAEADAAAASRAAAAREVAEADWANR